MQTESAIQQLHLKSLDRQIWGGGFSIVGKNSENPPFLDNTIEMGVVFWVWSR